MDFILLVLGTHLCDGRAQLPPHLWTMATSGIRCIARFVTLSLYWFRSIGVLCTRHSIWLLIRLCVSKFAHEFAFTGWKIYCVKYTTETMMLCVVIKYFILKPNILWCLWISIIVFHSLISMLIFLRYIFISTNQSSDCRMSTNLCFRFWIYYILSHLHVRVIHQVCSGSFFKSNRRYHQIFDCCQ